MQIKVNEIIVEEIRNKIKEIMEKNDKVALKEELKKLAENFNVDINFDILYYDAPLGYNVYDLNVFINITDKIKSKVDVIVLTFFVSEVKENFKIERSIKLKDINVFSYKLQ